MSKLVSIIQSKEKVALREVVKESDIPEDFHEKVFLKSDGFFIPVKDFTFINYRANTKELVDFINKYYGDTIDDVLVEKD